MSAAGLLLIRADAGTQMGTGHVMRCLALAQHWRDAGGEVMFVTACDTPALLERLNAESSALLEPGADPASEADALDLVRLARRHGAVLIALDGYHFSPDYQRAVKTAGIPLLLFDDEGNRPDYFADLLLNQNAHARQELYGERARGARLLLGTQYALLRREFSSRVGEPRSIPRQADKLLITMGGSDPDNVMEKTIRALSACRTKPSEVRALVGAANPHRQSLEAAVADSGVAVKLEEPTEDMAEIMAWADFALTGAGTTLWELAFMGVPFAMLELVDHQRKVAAAVDAQGAGVNLGWHASLTPPDVAGALQTLLHDAGRRRAMSEAGRRLVDGLGPARVVTAIWELIHSGLRA